MINTLLYSLQLVSKYAIRFVIICNRLDDTIIFSYKKLSSSQDTYVVQKFGIHKSTKMFQLCELAVKTVLRLWPMYNLSTNWSVILTLFQAKVGMLDNLLDIEVAYSLLKSGEGDLAKDPLDVN